MGEKKKGRSVRSIRRKSFRNIKTPMKLLIS